MGREGRFLISVDDITIHEDTLEDPGEAAVSEDDETGPLEDTPPS
jgi:hypothetical protein